jgi:hypothetical protein
MSVTVRPYRKEAGGWQADVRVRLADGHNHRERRQFATKTMARHWGEARERHLLQHGLPPRRKESSRLKEFMPRALDDARANRQKPSTIASKQNILDVHLVP